MILEVADVSARHTKNKFKNEPLYNEIKNKTMAKLSQTQKIASLLKKCPEKRFTAREIAKALISLYPEEFADKRANPRFSNDNAFISQLVAEIGAQKRQIQAISPQIKWQDKPRPRVYWFERENKRAHPNPEQSIKREGEGSLPVSPFASADPFLLEEALLEEDLIKDAVLEEPIIDEDFLAEAILDEVVLDEANRKRPVLNEAALYPILIDYLRSEHQLHCMRIDEKRSINSRGTGGNQWLHPDIVAMEALAQGFHKHVKNCVHAGGGPSVRLWSFEVKKELTMSNVRKSFFQAVSNSSWANEGYLVAINISDSKVEQELRILSALHGIGVILLNIENPSESELLLPAMKRLQIDWQSVNRIVEENQDFSDFLDLVSNYYQTGRLRDKDWN